MKAAKFVGEVVLLGLMLATIFVLFHAAEVTWNPIISNLK